MAKKQESMGFGEMTYGVWLCKESVYVCWGNGVSWVNVGMMDESQDER